LAKILVIIVNIFYIIVVSTLQELF